MSAESFGLFCVGLIFGAILERLDRRYITLGFRDIACRAWRLFFVNHFDRVTGVVGAYRCSICGRYDVEIALTLLTQDVRRWDAAGNPR